MSNDYNLANYIMMRVWSFKYFCIVFYLCCKNA